MTIGYARSTTLPINEKGCDFCQRPLAEGSCQLYIIEWDFNLRPETPARRAIFLKVLDRADIRSLGEVRLVGNGLNQIVAAQEAWNRAETEGLDLVQVSADDAKPLVVRIQDFNKLMFERKKAKQAQKKKKRSELKEIQLKANISIHDLQTKVKSIDKFLERGDKVKIVVRLKGRERDHPERAHELIARVIELVTVAYKFNKLGGPIAAGILEPAPK